MTCKMKKAPRADLRFMVRHRYMVLFAAVVLFLPPLSAFFQLFGSTNFCGEWCPRMFFVWRQGTPLQTYFSGFARSAFGAGLLLSILAVTLVAGRYWCSHICPIGGAMELLSRLVPKRLKIDYSGISAPAFRYGYLAVYLIAPALGLGSLCCSYCNFATVPRLFAAPFSSADMAYFMRTAGLINLALLILLGFLAKGGRAYCNLICPIGALDALANRLSRKWGMRVRVDTEKCSGCSRCRTICPTWAIDVEKTAAIDPLSCIPCRKCEAICPEGAISYGTNHIHQTITGQGEAS